MSFAEGFGSAFSQSFNAGLEREENKKQDAFKIAYADLIENRKTIQEKKDKDNAQIKQAKALTSLSGVDEAEWPTVYNMISSGVSPDKIREEIAAGTFTPSGGSKPAAEAPKSDPLAPAKPEAPVTPTPEAAYPPVTAQDTSAKVPSGGLGGKPAAPEVAAAPPLPAPKTVVDKPVAGTPAPVPAPVAAQTQEALPVAAKPAPAATPAPVQTAAVAPAPAPKKGIMSGLLGDLSGKFKGKPQVGANGKPLPAGAGDAYGRIGKALGKTGDEVQAQANETYTMGQGVPAAKSTFVPAPIVKKPSQVDLDSAFIEQYAAADAAAKAPDNADAQQRLASANRDLKAAQASTAFKSDAKARSEGNNASLSGIPGIVVNDQDPTHVEPVTAKMTDVGYSNVNGPEGNKITGRFIPYSPEEYKVILDLGNDYAAGVEDTAKRTSKIVPMLRSAGIMSQLVDETNGAVLQEWSAGAARNLVSGAKNIGNAIDLLNSAANQNGFVDPASIEKLRQEVQVAGQTDLATFLGPDINNLAAKSALFEAQRTLLAYDMAAANGSSGQALSNKDFQAMKETVGGATDAPNFKQKMANVIGQQLGSIEGGAAKATGFNARLKAFESLGKKTPYEPVEVDVGKLIQNANDPQVIKGWNIVSGFGGNPTGKGVIDAAVQNKGGGQPIPTPVDTSNLPVMASPADALKLPHGASFKTPDGRVKVNP